MIKYLLKYWKYNFLLIVVIIIGAVSHIGAAYNSGFTFNAIIAFKFNDFIKFSILSFVLFMIYLISLLIKIPFQNFITQKMLTSIRTDIANGIETVDYSEYHKFETPTFISWLSNDMNQIEQNGFSNIYSLITIVTETILATISLFIFHWSIILICLTMCAITILLPNIMSKKVNTASKNYSHEYENFVTKSSSILHGFDTLFVLNSLSKLPNMIKSFSNDLAKKSNKLKITIAISSILGGFGNVISQLGMSTIAAYLALIGVISFGSIITIGNLSSTIFNGVGNIINVLINLKTTKPILKKFNDFIYKERTSSNNILNDKISTIELTNLSFKYEDKNVLNNLSFKFYAKNKYAIIGKSGCGKSTLLNILCGKLKNYDGSIKINGIELSSINDKSIRKQILYIDQTPYIFNDSIKFNINLGDENITENDILNVLSVVGLKEYVDTLPEGINTTLSENGRNLSGGQKQRMALARGLVRNKNIILLDEATSNQDKTTALQIEKLLLSNENLTVIMISHNILDEIKENIDYTLELPNNL